jgi:D-alanyl-D-alanine carboxypeptidase (penicillin-binding protein 5/6)
MSYGEPARTVYRRRRPRLLGALLALIMLALPVFAALHYLGGDGRTLAERARGTEREARAALAPQAWPERGQAAIVIGDGRPAVSPDEQPAPIASLAKVMTAYLTLKAHPLGPGEDGFTMTVTASQADAVAAEAEEGQSVVAVRAGERLTERQLLEALLIPSGNNVARMLAAGTAGDSGSFVAEMNAEARALGMAHTTYTDPSGFDPRTVSTAADQLRVFRRAMRFAVFRQIVAMPATSLPVAGALTNFNPLLGAGYYGKTGSDSAAGGCLAFFTRVSVAGRRRTAVGVVMGQGKGSDTGSLLGAAAEAAERLVGSVAGADGGRGAFRPRIENRIRAGNGPPPKLGAVTDGEPAKELR